ncbi:hypothetical protein [Vibrio vulnificus]|uniref:hypothetical protein n=1 Tax=Vibrio vulnificus TaxID=672 RepID=UPI000CD23B6A|nr:hypothetical protein [Vibrio vulnificus]POC15127.1 hypothetical protein CRN42_22490 [Vibrio vulnificus]
MSSPSSLKVAVVSDLHFANSEKIQDSRSHSWLIFEPDGSMKSAEESPDDLDKNHQVKVDAHLVM